MPQTDEEQVADAERLERMMADPVMQRVLDGMEREAYEQFKDAKDDDGRRNAHALHVAVGLFKAQVNRVKSSAVFAADNIARKKKR